jgi:dephospho-CoA kinase
MIVIGIAGGVASGKSLVTRCFRHFGAVVLDGDRMGHEVLQQRDLIQQVVDRWGDGILNGDQIDRTLLARIVFAPPPEGPTALLELERLTHPLIGDRIKSKIKQARQDKSCQACVLDAPVMFKVGWDLVCDEIVFVDVSKKIRIERARERGWLDGELEKRESNQTSIQLKRAKATCILDNSGSIEATFEQAVSLWLGWGLRLPSELRAPTGLF